MGCPLAGASLVLNETQPMKATLDLLLLSQRPYRHGGYASLKVVCVGCIEMM